MSISTDSPRERAQLMSLDLKDFRVSDDTQINAPPPLRRPSQSITRSIRTESPYADDLTQGFLNCVDPQEMTTLAEEQLTTNSIVALLALHALNHTGNTTGNWQAPGVGSDVFRYLATKHLFEATSQEDDWTVQSVSEEEEQRDEEAAKRLLTLIGRLADWQACDSSDPSFSSTLKDLDQTIRAKDHKGGTPNSHYGEHLVRRLSEAHPKFPVMLAGLRQEALTSAFYYLKKTFEHCELMQVLKARLSEQKDEKRIRLRLENNETLTVSQMVAYDCMGIPSAKNDPIKEETLCFKVRPTWSFSYNSRLTKWTVAELTFPTELPTSATDFTQEECDAIRKLFEKQVHSQMAIEPKGAFFERLKTPSPRATLAQCSPRFS